MSDDEAASAKAPAMADYTALDDSALIARRREVREQLEHEPPNMADLVRAHHLLTTEVLRRTFSLRKQRPESLPGSRGVPSGPCRHRAGHDHGAFSP